MSWNNQYQPHSSSSYSPPGQFGSPILFPQPNGHLNDPGYHLNYNPYVPPSSPPAAIEDTYSPPAGPSPVTYCSSPGTDGGYPASPYPQNQNNNNGQGWQHDDSNNPRGSPSAVDDSGYGGSPEPEAGVRYQGHPGHGAGSPAYPGNLPVVGGSYMPPGGQQLNNSSQNNNGLQCIVLQDFSTGRPIDVPFVNSMRMGKKKALSIGINYFGQQGDLRGCINDSNNMCGFLIQRFGYKRDNIVQLTDDSTDPEKMPTRENILRAMQWLVKDAQPNDSLFFHFSGLAGQTKDLDGDEADGYDEVIYPVDFERTGHIVDDEMHAIMVKPLPLGCRLNAIFDSSHSGSILDLPYTYSTRGVIKRPDAGQGLGGMIKNMGSLIKTVTGQETTHDYARKIRTSPADVISWSACKDSQTSGDVVVAGRAAGLMSYAFIEVLKQRPRQTYQELLNSIRDVLRNKYSSQKPQLSSSHPMDTTVLFVL